MERMTHIQYFTNLLPSIAKRSTCLRRNVGAIIVKDKSIISTGYNGSPAGCKHCNEIGCIRQKLGSPSGTDVELCRGAHAEMNAICQAARFGICLDKSIIYSSTYPCVWCMKMIINSGIRKVYYIEDYPDTLSKQLANEAGIECIPVKMLLLAANEKKLE